MTGLLGVGRQTFSSLANANFRRYFLGQAISRIGTWMQMIAQGSRLRTAVNPARAP